MTKKEMNEQAIKTLTEIAKSLVAPPADRIRAAQLLIHYSYDVADDDSR